MECILKNRNDNKIIGRSQMHVELAYSGSTPSNDMVKKELAQALKVDESLLVVKHIYSRFGEQKADVVVLAYDDKIVLEQFEVIKKKPKKAEAPKAEGKPVAAKK